MAKKRMSEKEIELQAAATGNLAALATVPFMGSSYTNLTDEEEAAAAERLATAAPPPSPQATPEKAVVIPEREKEVTERAPEPQASGSGADSVLLPDAGTASTGLQRIPLAELIPSPTNPRTHFDQSEVEALAANIRQQGLIEPIIVRPLRAVVIEYRVPLAEDGLASIDIPPGSREKTSPSAVCREFDICEVDITSVEVNDDCGYEIVAGERRFRAYTVLHNADRDPDNPGCGPFAAIDCIVRDLSDAQVREIQLSENLQREDLSAADLANSYRELVEIEKTRGTKGAVQTVADRLGVSKSVVDQALQMLKAIPEVLTALRRDFISKNHAVDCSRLEPAAQMAYLCECLLGYQEEAELRWLLENQEENELEESPASVRTMRVWIEVMYPTEEDETQPALFAPESSAAVASDPEAISEDTIAEAAGMMERIPEAGADGESADVSGAAVVRSIRLSGYVQIERQMENRFIEAVRDGRIEYSGSSGVITIRAGNGDFLTFTGTGGEYVLSSHELKSDRYSCIGSTMSKTKVVAIVRALLGDAEKAKLQERRPGNSNEASAKAVPTTQSQLETIRIESEIKARRAVVERERVVTAIYRVWSAKAIDLADLLVEGTLIENIGREETAHIIGELGWKPLTGDSREDYMQHLLSEYHKHWAKDRWAFVAMAGALGAAYVGGKVMAGVLKGFGLDAAKVAAGELPPQPKVKAGVERKTKAVKAAKAAKPKPVAKKVATPEYRGSAYSKPAAAKSLAKKAPVKSSTSVQTKTTAKAKKDGRK
jgi:ParB/RepB/Spo0J family partition protein